MAPSLGAWARSASFRVWADDWVLAPAAEVVWHLPIDDPEAGAANPFSWASRQQFSLYVSVSPTMGVVSRSWFTTKASEVVCGCIGPDRILVSTETPAPTGLHAKFSVVSLSGKVIDPLLWEVTLRPGSTYLKKRCNRNWIAVVATKGELHIWKVVGSCVTGPKVVPTGMNSGTYKLSLDVVMMFPEDKGEVKFIDLESTFKSGELVEKSPRIVCKDKWPCDVVVMPDGSVSTLHLNFSSAGLYLVNSITHQRHKFPERHNATVIDQSHLLVAPWFETTHYQVYHTSNLLEASRCVPSTWASVGQSGGFALICSTTQPQGRSDATEIQFEVRDGATGILLGVFPVPIHPPFCLRV